MLRHIPHYHTWNSHSNGALLLCEFIMIIIISNLVTFGCNALVKFCEVLHRAAVIVIKLVKISSPTNNYENGRSFTYQTILLDFVCCIDDKRKVLVLIRWLFLVMASNLSCCILFLNICDSFTL